METIQASCSPGIEKWHWYNVMKDLEEQGGLSGVIIDPLTVNAHGCGGKTKKGTAFFITWVKDAFLLLTVSQEETELVNAFAKIVEYRPFCQYISKKSGLITLEWDKNDPDGRYLKLESAGELQLQRVQ